MGKVSTQAQERSGFLNKHLVEIFKNHKLIKIFQKENFESNRSDELISNLANKVKKINTVYVRSTPIMETLTGIMIAFLIFYSGKLIMSEELEFQLEEMGKTPEVQNLIELRKENKNDPHIPNYHFSAPNNLTVVIILQGLFFIWYVRFFDLE